MKLIQSFGHAWDGIAYCFKTQLNFRIHLLVLLLVAIAGYFFAINTTEWLFIIGCTMLVLSLELINTAIEHVCDTITTEIHPAIKIIKDAAAAAVLLVAVGSVVTGLIIFLPKILNAFK
jgi:undecaprenol kinase/diacylglycerol kinase (ATP)